VVRFDRARRRLLRRQAEGGWVVLAGFAAECGYYDQAHLARDLRELAGCPPSGLPAERAARRGAPKRTSRIAGGWE
jgi:AraC-like DNA-binding protein